MPKRLIALAAAATLLTPACLLAQLHLETYKEKTPIQITADLSEAPRHLYHAEIDIPVHAGPLTLITPQWIPGNHGPTGPVSQIVGVEFYAAGKDGQLDTLTWRRDNVNLYEFHLEVPAGVTHIHAHLDAIVSSRASQHLACLEWERLMLYPAGYPVAEIPIQPSVTVPAGWGIGTALTPEGSPSAPPPVTGILEDDHHPTAGAMTTHYAATTVEQLQDSPVIAGQYFHEFPLAPEVTPKHYIDVVSDDPEDSQLRPELLAEISNLVREAGAAYASHHYNVYHFLLTLSDTAGGEGLEHGQSSDNGVGEKGFGPTQELGNSDLLSHEFTHSWNGKYRRPEHLYQPTFADPQWGQLLWVYEGMTQYMGNVLAARSGLKNQEQYRDMLADSAASLDNEPGRNWRSTEDTAIASSVDRHPTLWANWERGQAYYQEGELLWLDADTLIRQKTGNAKSLTDFQHIFLGKGGNTGPLIVPYNRAELIHDLNEVVPYDWAAFLHQHIDIPHPHADFDGITRGGWKLVYTDKPSKTDRELMAGGGRRSGFINDWYSLGLRILPDGTIYDVRWNSPADAAGAAPGYKLVGIGGEVFSASALHDAIAAAKGTDKPITLLVSEQNELHPITIAYHDGDRYPSLVRADGTPDYMDDITKPLTTPPATTSSTTTPGSM